MYLKLNKKAADILKESNKYPKEQRETLHEILEKVRYSSLSLSDQYVLIDDLFEMIFAALNRGETINDVLGEDPIDYVYSLIKESTTTSNLVRYDTSSEMNLVIPSLVILVAAIYSIIVSLVNGQQIDTVSLNLGYIAPIIIILASAPSMLKVALYEQSPKRSKILLNFATAALTYSTIFIAIRVLENVIIEPNTIAVFLFVLSIILRPILFRVIPMDKA